MEPIASKNIAHSLQQENCAKAAHAYGSNPRDPLRRLEIENRGGHDDEANAKQEMEDRLGIA
jgi:hypothetical protein